MAIDSNIYSPTQFRFAIAQESVFGTAKTTTTGAITAFASGSTTVVTSATHGLSDGDFVYITGTTSYNGYWVISNKDTNTFTIQAAFVDDDGTGTWYSTPFHELLITEPVQFPTDGLVRDKAKKSDGKRVWSNTDTYINTHGSGYTTSVTGILTDLTADLLLYGVMQDVTEAAGTPFLKTFEWDGSTTGNNSGAPYKFFTLNGYDPGADMSWSLESAVIQSLDISAAYGTNGGRASFTAVFYSGFPPVNGATVTPSQWIPHGTDYYPIYTLQTKTVATADVVVDSFNINWNNGAVRVGADANGDAQTYHFPMFDVTGSAKVKYDANTLTELAKFVLTPDGGSAESQINLVWGNGSADGTLAFDINAIYTGNGKDFGNEAGVFVDLPFEGVDDGTSEAIEVLCANATDRSW